MVTSKEAHIYFTQNKLGLTVRNERKHKGE